ncbi:hypothetical protein H0H81_001455 [Sphagnurus paluster]|uniref:Uncharacterized protein n=1 Tax=Sphagnurus paluster TaxID=117069 RepID=A0A9P7FTK1_9AGAR|nr:hypothetical protein H0H81_001455 [Sphagnurus paluster]
MQGDEGEFRWLYANPDAPAGSKGAFQSDLVAEIFSQHLKHTLDANKDYSMPVGGLGLCTAAMEHALELWADGEAPVTSKAKPGTEDNTRNSKKAFGGEDWIACTAGYVLLAKGLSEDEHWPVIINKAETHIQDAICTAAGITAVLPSEAQATRAGLSLWYASSPCRYT